jgi:hypothetical protein
MTMPEDQAARASRPLGVSVFAAKEQEIIRE